MSKLHVNQIAGFLNKNLDGLIDLSDYDGHQNNSEKEKAFLTRALAALSVSHLVQRPAEELCKFVTDGSQDGGIDLIYFDEKEKILYLAQTKWHSDGNGSISQSDLLKFLQGVKKIFDLDLATFNQKVKAREADIELALYDANARFVLVVGHTGQDDLSDLVKGELKNFVDQQNDTSEIMAFEVLNQAILHKAVSAGLSGAPISVEVQLSDWGQLRDPYHAIYGRVYAADVATWYKNHGPKLFEKNLRQFLPASTVNQDIVDSITAKPEEFWYHNNGITALAHAVKKKPLGGNVTGTGIWECAGFSVVNGAQTVGSIHAAYDQKPDVVENASVSIRIIEIADDTSGFGLAVTKNTNTQNSVEKRDFVALDPEQERLRQELRFEGVDYAYKSGSPKGDPARYFDLTEATIALACSQSDVGVAVQAKREISKLWDDIRKPPYRTLFNPAISGPQIWNMVQILRATEKAMQELAVGFSKRESLIAAHGNRFVQWALFKTLGINKHTIFVEIENRIYTTLPLVVRKTISLVDNEFPDSYPASLFKNASKCKVMAEKI